MNLSAKQFEFQMRPHILWGLVWIQNVCKGHQGSLKFAASKCRVNKVDIFNEFSSSYMCQWSSKNKLPWLLFSNFEVYCHTLWSCNMIIFMLFVFRQTSGSSLNMWRIPTSPRSTNKPTRVWTRTSMTLQEVRTEINWYVYIKCWYCTANKVCLKWFIKRINQLILFCQMLFINFFLQ